MEQSRCDLCSCAMKPPTCWPTSPASRIIPRGVAHRVRSEFLGVVVVVGASPTGLLASVGLDQFAAAVRSQHLAVGAYPHLATDVACRQ